MRGRTKTLARGDVCPQCQRGTVTDCTATHTDGKAYRHCDSCAYSVEQPADHYGVGIGPAT